MLVWQQHQPETSYARRGLAEDPRVKGSHHIGGSGLQVIVSPLVRLTNASNPPLEEVGTPEGLLNSLGSYIT